MYFPLTDPFWYRFLKWTSTTNQSWGWLTRSVAPVGPFANSGQFHSEWFAVPRGAGGGGGGPRKCDILKLVTNRIYPDPSVGLFIKFQFTCFFFVLLVQKRKSAVKLILKWYEVSFSPLSTKAAFSIAMQESWRHNARLGSNFSSTGPRTITFCPGPQFFILRCLSKTWHCHCHCGHQCIIVRCLTIICMQVSTSNKPSKLNQY